jgi:tetratricopeptide (TPR) repeat protein
LKRPQYIAFAVAAIVALGIWLLPTTPASEEEEAAVELPTSLDAKVQEAVAIIQNGTGAPMVAIGMLQEVLKEDPNHEEALLWLGNFSMMSGQWDKALDRFHQLSTLFPDNETYAFHKMQSLAHVGDTSAAVNVAQQYLENYPEASQVSGLLSEYSH